MRWTLLLGGLGVWAAHFFLLYGIASALPGSNAARWLTLGATAVAAAINGWIISMTADAADGAPGFEGWTRRMALTGASLSLVAVLWQGLPALV